MNGNGEKNDRIIETIQWKQSIFLRQSHRWRIRNGVYVTIMVLLMHSNWKTTARNLSLLAEWSEKKRIKISCSFVCYHNSSNIGSALFRCRWTELNFKLPLLCASYELQLIWMCMTDMLTFTKIRTKIYGKNNNNNNESHYGWAPTWAHRKKNVVDDDDDKEKKRTIAQMVHFRSFNYITLLVRLSSAFVCCIA